jgi:hypothetical protein
MLFKDIQGYEYNRQIKQSDFLNQNVQKITHAAPAAPWPSSHSQG